MTGPWLQAMCGADMVRPPPPGEVGGRAGELEDVEGAPLGEVEGAPLGELAEPVGLPPEPIFEPDEHPAITAAAASNAATGIARVDR